MSENFFHAGALVLFVALCAAAVGEVVRAEVTAVAAKPAVPIAASQAVRANERLAQAPVEAIRRAPQ